MNSLQGMSLSNVHVVLRIRNITFNFWFKRSTDLCEHSVGFHILTRFPSAGVKCFATFVFASLFCSLIFHCYILISFISKILPVILKKQYRNEWFRHILPEERGGVYRMTLMFCMPGGPKLLGGLKKKNYKLDKVMSIYFIYIFFLSFVLSFCFVQTGASQKDVYKTTEKTLVIFSLPDLIV